MLHVLQPTPKKNEHVFVVQRVDHVSAVAARPNEPELPQAPQLVGRGRFTDADDAGQVAYGHFALSQCSNDPYPTRVAQGAKQLGQFEGIVIADWGTVRPTTFAPSPRGAERQIGRRVDNI
jgi:hypothetical protein